ncbi:DNA internalization-related competence protein ComEC/Rec2 [Dyella psychrodurans]|uniref:DNA internalization-related competence protein ComEC/Rec2 n=1 Tax=Dyella psychrodurans TaxID=1927960 RepID=A0A370XE99_9GAMM|nr:DNA internalization-related competence protein ComEC/Rec2 [Dyella psychrodurans]RDS86541.1 DNA internalization-related competence protein ComEC/Rec2 [Dyella psychrodurans]
MLQEGKWPGAMAAAFALLAGVAIVQWLPSLPSRMAMAALVVCGAVLAWRFPRTRLLAIVVLGVAWGAWRGSAAMDARLPRAWEGQDFSVIGRVEGLAQTRADATSFEFQIEQVAYQGQTLPWHGLAHISWYNGSAADLEPCSRWQMVLHLRRPRGLIDPGGTDGERSALAHGIVAVGYVRDDPSNQRKSVTRFCIDRLRASLADDIRTHVSDAHDAALLRAFTVGDTRGLEQHDWDVARANGVSHLIAISGFHVGVVAVFGAWLCYAMYGLFPSLALRFPRVQAQAIAALAWASFYAALAGFGMPTVRTVLMIAAVAMTRCFRRASGAGHALALALMAIVIVDPLAVLEAGFWMSFVGVGFLILCLETRGHGIRAFLRELTAGQLVMTVALLPMTQWFFGEASLVGAVSNLVAVPFISFMIVPCALIGVLLLMICPPLALPVLQLAGKLSHAQWWLLEQTATWPGAHWYLPAVQPWALALATVGALWLFMPAGVPLRIFGALLFLPLVYPMRQVPADGAFQVWVLDVGQGLSVVVRTHDHALVYDAGARYPSEFDLGSAVVIPSLHALGIDHLDTLMISHADNDHAGGAPAVAAAFPEAARYAGEPERMHLPMTQCATGQQWTWDGVHFRVLNPDETGQATSDNDRSCVLLIEGVGGRMLLTGDIASDIEPRVAAALGSGPAPVLQMPHHGSATSSSPAFIAAIKPELAIASAGWLNRFGHPRPEVLQRYAAAGVPVFNTALDGAVQIDFPADKAAYVAVRWRWQERHYWRE